jgi:hypothetical protein
MIIGVIYPNFFQTLRTFLIYYQSNCYNVLLMTPDPDPPRESTRADTPKENHRRNGSLQTKNTHLCKLLKQGLEIDVKAIWQQECKRIDIS